MACENVLRSEETEEMTTKEVRRGLFHERDSDTVSQIMEELIEELPEVCGLKCYTFEGMGLTYSIKIRTAHWDDLLKQRLIGIEGTYFDAYERTVDRSHLKKVEMGFLFISSYEAFEAVSQIIVKYCHELHKKNKKKKK